MKRDKIDLYGKDITLIITGCISPQQNQRFLVLKNTEERLEQYVNSIVFYIEKSQFSNIVYCDNSGYIYENVDDLYRLAQMNGKNFEWLSFDGNKQKILECGKGYGEGEIINYAIENSKLLKESKTIAKVTGRLIIANINQILYGIEEKTNYFNRDIYRGHGIDTRFYICDKEYYFDNLRELYKVTSSEIGKEIALEDIFYKIMTRKKQFRSLFRYPDFKGISGGCGRDYSKTSAKFIQVSSLFCYVNLFNQLYPIVLAWQKIKLVVNDKIQRIRKREEYDS